MKCPIDGSDLVMTDRQGIEIDYCPKCRGVWLDRGELDKIIERASPPAAPPAPAPSAAFPGSSASGGPAFGGGAYPQRAEPPRGYPEPRYSDDDDDRYRQPGYDPRRDPRYDPRYGQHPHKKKSLLGELFDFD
jgi:Zn-finger nucleic acid-binding protein